MNLKVWNESGQASAVLILILLIIVVVIICVASGNAIITNPDGSVSIGQPERFAQATALALAADLAREATREVINYEATVNAANGQATATAAAASAMQTAEAAQVSIEATQTAVPYNAALASTNAQAEMATEWTGVAALVIGLVLCGLAGLAIIAWLNTQARIVRPTPTGQMPMLWDGHTLVDPNRMVGPAATMPTQSDWLVQVARAVYFLQTGQALPQEARPPVLADAGADADHLLEVAKVAGAASITAAMFRPDNADAGRRAKIELLKKGSPNAIGILGGASSIPTTRIVVTGDSAIEALARQLGDHLPQAPQLTEPVTLEANEDVDDSEDG